jgi:hypothetical protein
MYFAVDMQSHHVAHVVPESHLRHATPDSTTHPIATQRAEFGESFDSATVAIPERLHVA